jgi:hypothetical protein
MTRRVQTGGSIQNVLVIVMIIILALSVFGVYKYFDSYSVAGTQTKQFLPYIHDAKIGKRVNAGSVPDSLQGNEYNINMWIYINDYIYRYKEDKVIIQRGESYDNVSNPTILLTANTNTLRIITNVETNLDTEGEEDGLTNICDIPNIPLQRWVNINISLSDKVLDVFLNGKLVKTGLITGYPKPNMGPLNICKEGGFHGFISNIAFTNRTRSITDIQAVYRKGPALK